MPDPIDERLREIRGRLGPPLPRTDEYDEAGIAVLVIAYQRDIDFLLDQIDSLREVERAGRTFQAKHERFHPDHWVAAKSDKYCDACDFCAALDATHRPPLSGET